MDESIVPESESKNGLRHSSQPFKTGIFNAQF